MVNAWTLQILLHNLLQWRLATWSLYAYDYHITITTIVATSVQFSEQKSYSIFSLSSTTNTHAVPSEFLVFTQNFHNHSEIRQISLDFPGRYIDTLVPIDNLGSSVSFLSYDLVFHQIYWTEIHPPAIKRAYINGSNVETFIETGLKHPEGIAVDSYSRNLYWVDSVLNRIEVARLSNSKNRRVLFSSHLDHPRGLALDLHQE